MHLMWFAIFLQDTELCIQDIINGWKILHFKLLLILNLFSGITTYYHSELVHPYHIIISIFQYESSINCNLRVLVVVWVEGGPHFVERRRFVELFLYVRYYLGLFPITYNLHAKRSIYIPQRRSDYTYFHPRRLISNYLQLSD